MSALKEVDPRGGSDAASVIVKARGLTKTSDHSPTTSSRSSATRASRCARARRWPSSAPRAPASPRCWDCSRGLDVPTRRRGVDRRPGAVSRSPRTAARAAARPDGGLRVPVVPAPAGAHRAGERDAPRSSSPGGADAAGRARVVLERVGLGERLGPLSAAAFRAASSSAWPWARALRDGAARALSPTKPTGNLDSETGEHVIELLFKMKPRARHHAGAGHARRAARTALRPAASTIAAAQITHED